MSSPACKMHHECGLFGVYSSETKNLAEMVYYGLFALQHRGQESAGIAVAYDNKLSYHKNSGLVSEVFDKDRLKSLPEGDIAIGHVRYATANSSGIVNAQPIVFSGKSGRIAIGFNGRLTNGAILRNNLIEKGVIFQGVTDCEVIAALINSCSEGDVVQGVVKACAELRGGFAVVLITSSMLIAFRDRNAIIPLVIGKYLDDTIVASESCALDSIGGELIRDLAPGEIAVIDGKGIKSFYMDGADKKSCIFEMSYLARSDSSIDGKAVYEARFEAGRKLARLFPIEADLVAGAPDSGVVSARGYSAESGIPYMDALCKNRYIGRAFIQPDQVMREKSVRIKLNAVRSNIEGKRVILVDDSIVRGTTCKRSVEMLKQAGAKEVHLMIASPPIKHPCYYGVDMTDYGQLMAANHNVKEMCAQIGADSINYIPLEDLIDCSGKEGDRGFCTACFTGEYPIQLDKK